MSGKYETQLLFIAKFDYDTFIRYITIGHKMPDWLTDYYIQITKSYYTWKMRNYD